MTDDAPVLIYGKDSCQYTTRAREAYAAKGRKVVYLNVREDDDALAAMLLKSAGARRVPVIDDGGTITIGFGGT